MSRLKTHRLAVIAGDGIGPEVTAQAMKVLSAAAEAEGVVIEPTDFDLGAARYLASGEVLPDAELAELAGFDAIFLGAVGDPRVPPGILEGELLLRLRQELDLYVNLRPARLFDGVPGPMSKAGGIDVVIVRENTEGLYCRRGRSEGTGAATEYATELSVNTAAAVERIVGYAFDLAERQKRKLTLVHKTNVLEHAGGLYMRVFKEAAARHPAVPTEYQHVDAAALLIAADPRRFSCIVTDNLFGDILSDLTAALAGGIGFVGSGNIHPGKASLFEPVHGSAPGIAGTGKANPIGAILSAAIMLEHIGETHAANRIESAVSSVAGRVAAGGMTCSQIGDLVAEEVA